ncbi:DUF3592 domain-containing protein [Embleya sp. NPDC020630]|uniref:DUF3592 domain-containing protein n=1 Tax=Embleya sp. NPDC020630 TaxID=3363979 RepID=UPI0037A58F82
MEALQWVARVFGVIMACGWVIYAGSTAALVWVCACGRRGRATVVEGPWSEGGGADCDPEYYVRVEFDPGDGSGSRVLRRQLASKSQSRELARGTVVPIAFRPTNPEGACLFPDTRPFREIANLAVTGVSVAAFLIGGFIGIG